jgi:hypothetical protein
MQGHCYGLNAAAAALLNAVPDAEWEAAMVADGGLDKEDQVVAALLDARGVARVHCGHFVADAASYATSPRLESTSRGYSEHPKTVEPITLHKALKLGALRAHLPDALCVPDAAADEDWTWKC